MGEVPINHRKIWTLEHDDKLLELWRMGEPILQIASILGRTENSVWYRLLDKAVREIDHGNLTLEEASLKYRILTETISNHMVRTDLQDKLRELSQKYENLKNRVRTASSIEELLPLDD